jgi:Na+/proline symporter/signal transduction histidine kinase
MLQGWIVVVAALAFLGCLFAVASHGDRTSPGWTRGPARPYIYALGLGIYCTSWTIFGAVSVASVRGFDFLPIYLGATLMFTLGLPVMLRVLRLVKSQNITSIADFVAARYGKNHAVAALVAIVAALAVIPYVALQLKAVSLSLGTVLEASTLAHLTDAGRFPVVGDLSLAVALSLAGFAALFGTRHVEATEHQNGLMLAIAMQSAVTLAAFLAVGVFVTWGMFDGFGDILGRARALKIGSLAEFGESPNVSLWTAMTLVAVFCTLVLPRQFHATMVENQSEAELRRAAWLFPLYLVLINLFVVPLALAGLIVFRDGTLAGHPIDSDMFTVGLPIAAGSQLFTVVAFLGGLSAATAMITLETVALAIMLSNEIAMPLLLRGRDVSDLDMRRLLLVTRRWTILVVLVLAYAYYRAAGSTQFGQIGVLSLVAVAQLGPAFFGGLFWRGGTARGAMAGILVGLAVWAYTMLLPNFAASGLFGGDIVREGAFGVDWLRPQALFDFDLAPLAHTVLFCLAANTLAYVAVSLLAAPSPIEESQAKIFLSRQRLLSGHTFRSLDGILTVGRLMALLERYLGVERTRKSFQSYAAEIGIDLDEDAEADTDMLRFAEHSLASAIGAASSRLVLSLLLRNENLSPKTALRLLDDASAAIQSNRDLLQTALDQTGQGVSVFDRDLRLLCWNQEYCRVFDMPANFLRVGTPLSDIIRFNAGRGVYGDVDDMEPFVADRIQRFAERRQTVRSRLMPSGRVIEVRPAPMPDGGTVTTYTDITDRVAAEQTLQRVNETLERRVRERTLELTRLNEELARAKATAEAANISKTRFLAAASHDILQPLNAARLYVTSLVERTQQSSEAQLVRNVEASLDTVEEILATLLDISRLDSGAMKPEFASVGIDDIMRRLEVEYAPVARDKNLDLVFVRSRLVLRSDRRLLLRLLQNLVSNALKYTSSGKVVVGCRRLPGAVRIEVWDTGHGIPASQRQAIFREFHRLDRGMRAASGVGLGLSIVERIAKVLNHDFRFRSTEGRGSMFSVEVPRAATDVAVVPFRSSPRLPAALSGFTVLCIDNEPDILAGMRMLLGGWGCVALAARGASEALALLAEADTEAEIVLADYHLDEDDGLIAIDRIRRVLGRDIPAVLLTADSSPWVRAAARNAGIQILAKPLKPAALRAMLAVARANRTAAE